ncbi:hypothetical protein ACFX1Q_028286 [Malus domestica]
MRGYGRDEFHQSVKEYDDFEDRVRYGEAEEGKEDTKRTKVTVARLEFRQCLKEQQRKKFETDGGSSRDKSYEKKKLPYDKIRKAPDRSLLDQNLYHMARNPMS